MAAPGAGDGRPSPWPTGLHRHLAIPPRPTPSRCRRQLTVRAETINRWLRETCRLLDQAGYTITASPHRIDTTADPYAYATANGVIPSNIKTAS